MTEQVTLSNSDFQDNTISAFGALRHDHDFSDVTLACADGEQVEAHKFILASSSPFFLNLLRQNKHAHPLIYMRNVKSEDLVAIVDFIYSGETNVCQENLDAFLSMAEELQIKGLTVNEDNEHNETEFDERENECHGFQTTNVIPKQENVQEEVALTKYAADAASVIGNKEIKQIENKKRQRHRDTDAAALYNEGNFNDFQTVGEKVKSLMQKSQNQAKRALLGPERTKRKGDRWLTRRADMCTVCGKEGEGTEIQNHIESNHLEGVSIPCNLCEKSYRTRKGFKNHVCDKTFVRSGRQVDATTPVWF